MKEFSSLLKVDLYRALLSVNFFIAVVFIMIVMFISSFGFITETSDVVYLLNHALTGSGSNLFILCIAPILPYGMAFALDVEEKVLPFWIIRTGTTTYAISKFTSAVIAGFLAVSMSIIIFALSMALFFPLANDVANGAGYIALLENNKPILYVLIIAIHYALSAVLFAGGAIAISTFIPDKFSAIAIPIVIYFVLVRLTDLSSLPFFLKPSFIVQSMYSNPSPLITFLYKLVPVICILGVLLFITMKQITKRTGIT